MRVPDEGPAILASDGVSNLAPFHSCVELSVEALEGAKLWGM